MFQNNETAAMLGLQTNPVRVELFRYVNGFFYFDKFALMLATLVKTLYRPPGGTLYEGHGEVPPKRGTFFRLYGIKEGRDFTR